VNETMVKYRKQIFLNELPRYKNNVNRIDWCNSIGFKVEFIYKTIEDWVEILDYKTKNQMLTIEYKGKKYKIKTGNFLLCRLGKIIGEMTSDFKIEIGERFKDDKRDITITDRKVEKRKHGKSMVDDKWYKYYCNKCNWDEGWIVESNLLGKKLQGCTCCSLYANRAVKGINDIATTHPHLVKYFKNVEDTYTHTHGSEKIVLLKCTDCNNERKMSVVRLSRCGFTCKKCSDKISLPNKTMFNILEQLSINFETEHSPKWIKPKRYDFYIPSINKIIEMDGGFHTRDNNMSGQTAKESKYIDDEKDRLALENGIEVIRIDCDYGNDLSKRFEYIKNNILKGLNNLFDLSKINWNKCEEYALSNLVKQACEYKRNNIELTAKEIGKMMKYNKATIISWLKIGNNLTWCDYDPKQEHLKNTINMIKNNLKPIEMFKDNISLGKFSSANELEILSKTLFDIQLDNGCISRVCLGKQKRHQGFTFKFINEEIKDNDRL
jgi:very-short-patch-repair endonuclease